MEGNTGHVTVSNTGLSPVVATSWTDSITVGEDPSVAGWPTSDFLITKGNVNNLPRRETAGGTYTFRKRGGSLQYGPGEIAGWIQMVAVGSTTFFKDEE